MKQDQELRDHLTKLMRCGQAFMPLPEVLQNIKAADAGKTVKNLPYTLWKLIEHLRIALYDILEFSRNPEYQSPEWPDGYWPEEYAPADQAALDASIKAIKEGIETMVQLVQDPENDLFEPFPHGDGQTLLREALLVAEHNAYHLGEIVVFKRLLGMWDKE
ncbi:DinB family protein [Pontibacter qinzhouensis]|uniref:DinB family protein n=1 Tax=Pontibacter qinzhouensis TaxID=2603253 RepID=A0A5C8J0X2_9BACT|nr:DinB family protein [Pontibacter qinzhouensis]TXK27240.1 DinB family protein [Pontibacter qinzhouensis]